MMLLMVSIEILIVFCYMDDIYCIKIKYTKIINCKSQCNINLDVGNMHRMHKEMPPTQEQISDVQEKDTRANDFIRTG